jgi:hypothetical protein
MKHLAAKNLLVSCAVPSGTNLLFHRFAQVEEPKVGSPTMLTNKRLDEEPGDWRPSWRELSAAIQNRIGQVLRDNYPAPRELPQQMSLLLEQLDRRESEGDSALR